MKVRIRRQWIFAGAAAIVAALAWFAPHPSDDLAASTQRGETAKVSAQPRGTSQLAALPPRAALGEQQGALFGSQVWTPPPQIAAHPVASAPSVPIMPPNPYKVAGTLIHDGVKRVLLLKGDRVYEAAPGDELDDGYRVDSIASDHVALLYVPLGKADQLPFISTFGADATHAALALARTPQTAIASAPRPAAIISGAAEEAKPAQLRWEGPESVRTGASFTVSLRVSSSQPLRATPMMLRYEPKLLEPLDVRAGKFFGDGKFSYRVNRDGSIFVGATGQGVAPGADAELVVVTFKPIKSGATAEVSLSSLALQGAAGRALAYSQVSAFRTAIQ
jgi:hypothetical protein